MTVLRIHYLTRHVVATDRTHSDAPEFPPHFGRVFMAMAAAYFETRGSDEERAVLEWIESVDAPSIQAGEAFQRTNSGRSRYEAVKTFVPVNDKLGGAGAGPVPRSRQSRAFPTAWLEDPLVYFKWDTALPENLAPALDHLCSKVTRIGHSSSLVQMWVAEDAAAGDSNWQPTNGISGKRMRVPEQGTLAYLERVFNAKARTEYLNLSDALEKAKAKTKAQIKQEIKIRFPSGAPVPERPILTRWQGYAKKLEAEEAQTLPGPFDRELIIFSREIPSEPSLKQPPFGLEATLQLTSALRNAAMKAAGDNVPEWLSGHQPDGKPSLKPHVAFFSLPFVGSKHADGHIMGLAMALPREIEPSGETKEESLCRVIAPLLFDSEGKEKTIRLWRNESGEVVWEWKLRREFRDYPAAALRTRTWTKSSTEWASVTPVVLHHYPKRGRQGDVERILFEAFESAGLPRPLEMRFQPVSSFTGAGHVKSMPEFTEGGERMCRYQVHVVVRFASEVEGPLLVGRGRFRGYGLLRPLGASHD